MASSTGGSGYLDEHIFKIMEIFTFKENLSNQGFLN